MKCESLYTIVIGEKEWEGAEGHFWENKSLLKRWEKRALMKTQMIFWKDKWALRRLVCDNGYLGVELTSHLLEEKIRVALRMRFMTTALFWEAPFFRQITGFRNSNAVSYKSLYLSCVFWGGISWSPSASYHFIHGWSQLFLTGSSVCKRGVRRTRIVWRRVGGEETHSSVKQCDAWSVTAFKMRCPKI